MPLGSSESHPNPCRISCLDAARFTRDTPRDFWESEAIYCVLSMTSKLILGGILLVNVIDADDRAEESAVGPERTLSLFNQSASPGP